MRTTSCTVLPRSLYPPRHACSRSPACIVCVCVLAWRGVCAGDPPAGVLCADRGHDRQRLGARPRRVHRLRHGRFPEVGWAGWVGAGGCSPAPAAVRPAAGGAPGCRCCCWDGRERPAGGAAHHSRPAAAPPCSTPPFSYAVLQQAGTQGAAERRDPRGDAGPPRQPRRLALPACTAASVGSSLIIIAKTSLSFVKVTASPILFPPQILPPNECP